MDAIDTGTRAYGEYAPDVKRTVYRGIAPAGVMVMPALGGTPYRPSRNVRRGCDAPPRDCRGCAVMGRCRELVDGGGMALCEDWAVDMIDGVEIVW